MKSAYIMGLVSIFDAVEYFCRTRCEGRCKCTDTECPLHYWAPGDHPDADMSWYDDLVKIRARALRDKERKARNAK